MSKPSCPWPPPLPSLLAPSRQLTPSCGFGTGPCSALPRSHDLVSLSPLYARPRHLGVLSLWCSLRFDLGQDARDPPETILQLVFSNVLSLGHVCVPWLWGARRPRTTWGSCSVSLGCLLYTIPLPLLAFIDPFPVDIRSAGHPCSLVPPPAFSERSVSESLVLLQGTG